MGDDLGGPGDRAEPAGLRFTSRPAQHERPNGWPVQEFPDFIDSRLNPDVRYYSYRVRARDWFGRISVLSAPVTVDAADRVPPPAPGCFQARWIDGDDPDLSPDDRAALNGVGAERGVASAGRGRWLAANTRPTPGAFRVYWHDVPFFTLAARVLERHAR